MPPIRVDTGSGSTASPGSLANAGKLPGANSPNPNTPWSWSSYNRPASVTYSDMGSASARNAFLIRQAMLRAQEEAMRRRLEEQRKRQEMERQQMLQEQNRRTAAEAPQAGVNLADTPLGTASPAAITNYFGPDGVTAINNLTGGSNQETPVGTLGQAIRRAGATIGGATDQAVQRIMQEGYDNIALTAQLRSASIYDEITLLENGFDNRLAQKQIEIWGRPKELQRYNPDTGQMEFAGYSWDYINQGAEGWGTPDSYLGLDPGLVPYFVPERPAEDASYEEWVNYRNNLQQAIRTPLYKPDSVMETLYNMGTEGVRQFQKTLLAAGAYDTNDVVKLGMITEKEIGFMRTFMEWGNLNGTTWEQQMSAQVEGMKQQLAAMGGGGGYGGGGGGGGTTVYKQIQYSQTSIAQARSLLVNILREALGREPTDSEVTKFVALLNKAENKSPTKTVTRTTTEGDMTTAVSRVTPSGVDAEYLAREFAQGIGGGEAFQANSEANYLTGFLESLGRASV